MVQRNTSRRRKACLIAIAAAIVGVIWAEIVVRRDPVGDFPLHWRFGARFLSGRYLYGDGHDPYPPAWGLACAPLTLLPLHAAQILAYPIGLAALVGLTILLDRLTRRSLPIDPDARFRATALALVLASRFLIRELPECGPNLLMVALAWTGLACWRARREGIGGACLGLAIALKCTPALFVPYFALKRQWRMVATTTLAAAAFSIAPAAWMGPESFASHLRTWAANCARGMGEADPSIGVLGQEEVKNHALRPVLARFLMDLPPGHLGRIDSRWRARGLDLPPAEAGIAIKAGLALLVIGMAWSFRLPATDREDRAILWEAAAVSILILLLSPLTWRQHCVGAYPACYLIARTAVARGGLPRWLIGALAVYAAGVIGLDRWVVGRAGTLLLESWGVTTWALLVLLAATLGCRGFGPEGARRERGDRPMMQTQRILVPAIPRASFGRGRPDFSRAKSSNDQDLARLKSALPETRDLS